MNTIGSKQLLLWALVAGWLGGCWFGIYHQIAVIGWGIVVAAAAAFFVLRHALLRAAALALAGFFGATLLTPLVLEHRTPPLPFGEHVVVQGIVVAAPPSFTHTRTLAITTGAFGRPVTLDVAQPQLTAVKVGEQISVEGELNPPPSSARESSLLRAARTGIVGEFARGAVVQSKGLENQDSPIAWLRTVRRWATAQLTHFPEPYAGLLGGLLWGDQKAIDPALYQSFALVGLAHIVALSGYNISILVRSLRFLVIFGIGWYALGGGLVVAAFVLFAGASASVVRAALFAGVMVVGELIGRPAQALPALGVVAVGMTAVNPALVTDISFQLSFLATAGLLILGPLVHAPLARRKAPEAFAEPLSATLAATAVTLPRIAGVFGRISLVAPLTNILVLPIVPATMLLGALAIAFGAVPGLGHLLQVLATIPLWWIVKVTAWAGRIPYASLNSHLPEIFWWGVMFVVGISAFWFSRRHKKSGSAVRSRR